MASLLDPLFNSGLNLLREWLFRNLMKQFQSNSISGNSNEGETETESWIGDDCQRKLYLPSSFGVHGFMFA